MAKEPKIIQAARGTLTHAASQLDSVNERIEAITASGGTVSKELTEESQQAQKAFNAAKREFGVVRGEILPSVKQVGAKVGGLFGKKAAAETETAAQETLKIVEKTGKSGILERIASKPFRIAANNPKTTLVVGSLAAVATGASFLKGRAEKRTERNIQNQLAEAQQLQSLPQQPQAPVSYMNSASYADVQAKMDADRAAGAAPASQTAALDARQSAPAAASPAV